MSGRLSDRLAWVADRLDGAPAGPVLEIGCGTGALAAELARRRPSATVVAIDRSAAAVSAARRAHADGAGRVTVLQTPLDSADLPEGRFSVAVAVNVSLFWAEATPDLQPLRRALAPEGRLYVVHQPPTPAKLRPAAERTVAILEQNGFTVSPPQIDPLPPAGASIVTATP